MNEGAVQQNVTAGIPNWWSSIDNIRQTPIADPQLLPHHSFLAAPPHHHYMPPQPLSASSSSWNDDCQELPDSWSQLLLGGLGGEEDKNMQIKKLENWEQQLLINQSSSNSSSGVDVKHENTYTTYAPPRDQIVEFQTNPSINSWSHTHQIISGSSPKSSCVTTLSSNNNMLDFSHQSLSGKLRLPDPSSPECNSTATAGGPASKKAKSQHPSQPQSTFKVRKEKLGDRITALHQLVSPFGKTDTASVLLEAIGYIRFLQSQVEALSLPYLNSGSRNISHQNHVQVERNSLFPEDPGQLLNEKRLKKRGLISEQGNSDEEAKKDLRSKGLCLVPISSTLHVGDEMNGADYWAQSAFGGNFQ